MSAKPSASSAASSSSSQDITPQANASVWPIQTCDRGVAPSVSATTSTAGRKRLTYVPLPQLDFEDVSFFCDFDYLAQRQLPTFQNGKNATLSTGAVVKGSKRKRSPSISDQLDSSPSPKKKGKDAAPSRQEHERVVLIETCCYFLIKAREAHDTDIVLGLKQAIQSAHPPAQLHIADVAFSVSTSASARSEDSIIGSTLRLFDRQSGNVVVELPLLDTDRTNDMDADGGKHTNGKWLASLHDAGRKDASSTSIAASMSLSLTSPPPRYPSDGVTAGSLFIKLSICVEVAVSSDATGPIARDRILDMARIVHFADQWPDPVESSTDVDAAFVYQNLRPASLETPEAVQHADLVPTLLPFQKRSTCFVLGREGWMFDSHGNLNQTDKVIGHDSVGDVGLWWKRVGPDLYYNWIEARFVRDAKLTLHSNFRGAMLAEEMGLGKTVEAVALILLNPDPSASSRPGWYDTRNEIDVVPTKTTLIVAPESLRAQWIEEIAQHAPGLAVYSYQGRTKAEGDVPEGLAWETWAQRFDVMIISYNTLSRELSTAKSAPARSRRHERKYERPRSPLVKLHFHRVLMDEVQMIGASSAAETVSMISRGSSIAVSGTPVKKLEDLRSCFRFLRVPGYLATNGEWQALTHPLLAPALVRVLQTIGTRHTKAQVASEMALPVQTRAVIPIEFTSIEAAFYADIWKEALSDIAYTQEGNPQTPDQQLDITKMRHHLLLLRQACTHPQVAVTFRSGVVGSKNLRSIDEVLELMIDSTRNELHSNRTSWFDRRIHRNILSLYRRKEDQRLLAASQFNDIEKEIHAEVGLLEQEIREGATFGPLYRFSLQELEWERKAEMRRRKLGADVEDDDKSDEDVEDLLESIVGDRQAYLILKEKRKARAAHVVQVKALLRNVLMKLHRLLQFAGNLYFQRGEFQDEKEKAVQQQDTAAIPGAECGPIKLGPDTAQIDSAAIEIPMEPVQSDVAMDKAVVSSQGDEPLTEASLDRKPPLDDKLAVSPERQNLKDKEDAAYVKAEQVRQRLLTEARQVVQNGVTKLERSQVKLHVNDIRASDEIFKSGGGILSHESYDGLTQIVDLLNRHAEVLFKWRDSIVVRLVRAVNRDVSLEREDDDQYQENLDTQAEAEVLLEMYRPLLSEREKILKGSVAVGATDKPRLFKEIEAAVRVARQNSLRGIVPDDAADEELLRVQQQQLEQFKNLDQERQSVSLSGPLVSLSDEAEHLKGLRDNSFRAEESALARQAHLEARRIATEQMKHLEKLRNEEKLLLTSLFNARSQYFKEIQVISDTVRDPLFVDLEKTIRATQKEEADLISKVDELERRLRYLTHLQMVQSTDQLDDAAKTCNICTDLIEIGILTNKCGHVCCESCWKEWQSQGHRTCVLCQTRVLPNEVHRIIYSNNKQTTAQDGQVGLVGEGRGDANASKDGTIIADPLAVRYHELDDALRVSLNRLAIQGRFGSKIDHVTKHVQHVISTTGDKSLIFSSFGRGLDVIAQSLTANGIRFVRVTGAGKLGGEAAKVFRSDPNVHVMLLHSEAQSAGLNLLSASHIHILEPLLNTSQELQAIGRVHRIGQTRETNVWCYYVKDTVEERILALSTYKGQSLYLDGRNTSAADGPSIYRAASNSTAADLSREDAKKWSAFGKGNTTGSGGTMRGDATSNSAELLACYFARYLPQLGRLPTTGSQESAQAWISGVGSNKARVAETSRDMTNGSGVSQEEDELTKMRRARLAAFEQRQGNGTA
ncbi:predicted ATP-dependent DNA helicase [Pseudozyma hubeiensis SY62]|uniref:Predicted ATP-dependent DNA helicase n=1 Tax=Pseudozyma hubeiensis (strain SY62) TaxID=1305764 RepID=R9P386_PSEHS|nr:predicted ATP-dependent DNA helicase [Pseudozyma hubeiensis SY62]GAC92570.1 predicted ATP-dependent DNA helicase [Pseudozyma hubeiensis SY62]